MDDTPSLEKYNRTRAKLYCSISLDGNAEENWRVIQVRCPECGELIKEFMGSVLTSLPPKRNARCTNEECDWGGYTVA